MLLVSSQNDRIFQDIRLSIAWPPEKKAMDAITDHVLSFVLGWPIPITMALLSSAKCCVAISLGLQTQSDHQGRIAVR